MATYNWSALVDGQTIAAFDPNVDLLVFDDTSITAANVVVNGDTEAVTPFITLSYGGKTVTVNMNPLAATITNVTFASGSQLLIGDNTTGTVNDDNANTLTGGSGNDQLIGLSGADSLSGGGGNDLFTMYSGNLDTWGNDTIRGGGGTDSITFNTNDSHLSGVFVTFNGFDVTLGALATITGGDGSSTITMSGVERVTGTELADTFTGTTATPVNGLSSDVTLVFDGAGGNDVFTGATGDGRSTLISYRSAGSGITVNLGAGNATNDGLGGADTFTNIDGVIGSNFADSITGGSTSISTSGTQLEFFEGFGGNDTINGGSGADRVQYDNSPGAVFVDLGNGTAQDGWGGFDALSSISQVRGSAFNDTMLGSLFDDQFEGLNGDDFIDGGAGFDAVRYTRATGAVFVNLATGEGRALDTVAGAGVGVDFFTHIEDVRGGDFADSMVGGGDGLRDSEQAYFNGAEAFEGRAGNDTISGGDTVMGSSSIDLARYFNAPSAVIVNLSAAVVLGVASNRANDGYGVNGNPAGIDTLININGAVGSGFNDTLIGGNNDEFFEGRKGADSIVGGGGIDALLNGDAQAAVTINLGAGTFNDGWGTVDIVSGIENVFGSDFDDSLTGDSNANRLEGESGRDTLAGGLGDDTLVGGDDNPNDVADYSAASGAVTVNLTSGTASGADGNDILIGIEYVWGSSASDTITGDEQQNFLRGNGGDDVLNGGGESLALAQGVFAGDFADYFAAAGAVTVSLALQGGSQNTIGAGNDTLSNFEGIQGSSFGDTLTGDGGNNHLRGGLGNDTLNGGAGIDWADYRAASGSVIVSLATNTSSGADGADALSLIEGISGSDFNDTLTGSTGDDWFRGRNGNDSISGGAGFDMVSYRPEGGGVTVNLGAGTQSGAAGNDVLVSIEGAEGTMFNDTLIGNNAAANMLFGFGGNDTLRATQGLDTLDGGDGSDTMDFSSVTGVTYGSTTAVNVNLFTHVSDLNRSLAGADSSLDSIETVFGTAGDDIFVGGDAAHATDSLGNRASERFRGNAGNDSITGGSGNDFFTIADYANNTDLQAVSANLSSGTVADGLTPAGSDTLVNVDQLSGGAGNDLLVGGSLSRAPSGTFFEVLRGNGGNDTLDGGTGNSGDNNFISDRADYSNNTSLQAVNVNLTSGIAIDGILVNGVVGTDTLINIEQVYGGAGNDMLTGNSGNNVLDGGAGNDVLDGGAGSDEAAFQQSSAGVIVNLSAGSIKVNGVTVAAGKADDGMGGTDTLINMESVRGSDFNDYIRGSDDSNTRQLFRGDAGNDTFDGGVGVDFANYSNVALVLGGLNAFIENGSGTVSDRQGGTDTLINIEGLAGTHGNDSLTGGLGNQWFRGNGGNDTINGGSGFDWVLYSSDPSGVTINLGAGTATDGWNGPGGLLALGGTDALTSIENAEASDYDDDITGTTGANELRGRAGNDNLLGGSGNDTLNGGDGNDTASYAGAGAVTVNLTTVGSQNTVGAGSDTLTFIENLLGSSLGDTLTGDIAANVLDGALGNDTLNGGDGNDTLIGGLGDDSIDGGVGVDTASYAGASAGVFVALFSPTPSNASAGNDTLTNIDNLIGSDFDDTLLGDSSANSLTGGAGNDILDGSGGADTAVGGTGDDFYQIDGTNDVVIENANEGVDTVKVQAAITYTLGANIENGEAAGFTGTNITGNGLNNSIFESSATLLIDNIFNGGSGNDAMSYKVANGAVTVSLALQGAAQNTVSEGSDTLIGFENLTGSDFGDTLTGDSAANKLNGEIGNDTIVGGSGNDTLDGGSGDDQLDGGIGLDTATYGTAGAGVTVSLGNLAAQNTGSAGTDTLAGIENLLGSNFDDTLTGTSGANVLNGGAGIDTVSYANAVAGVTVNLATTAAQNTVGMGSDTLSNFENLTGGNFNDTLTGTNGANVLDGGDGIDTANYANAGNAVSVNLSIAGAQNTVSMGSDTLASIENLLGSAFNDTLTGSAGNNVLDGGVGADTMIGGAGNDTYVVNASNDVVTEGAGAGLDLVQVSSSYTLSVNVENLILTGTGNISGFGNALDNTLTGNSGNNTLSGGVGTDTASYANAGSAVSVNLSIAIAQNTVSMGSDTLASIENLTGGNFNDTLTGSAGNNVLDGGVGADTMIGGAGNDTYVVNASNDVVTEGAGAGLDLVQASGSHALGANVENLILTGTGNISGFGNALDNTLTGNSGNNTLSGGVGTDTASYANAGSAVSVNLSIAIAQNTVSMGSDTLASIENLLGSAFNDTLTGSAGNNVLDGGVGADTMIGGAGNDTYVVNASNDVVTEGAGAGLDLVQASGSHTLSVNVENLILTGASNISGFGNALDNTLTGNSGNNTLNGGVGTDTASYANAGSAVSVDLSVVIAQNTVSMGSDTLANIENLLGSAFNDTLTGSAGNNVLDGGVGADTMIGGAGNDTYVVNASNDVVTEGAGAGLDLVQASGSYTLSVNVENLTLTGTSNIAGFGNALGNILTGNSGNNSLSSGAGNDTLIGGSGSDQLTGGGDSDTFDYNALADAGDTIIGFTAGAGGDKLDIDTLLTVLGYGGVDPLADGYVRVLQSGLDSLLQIDSDGGGDSFTTTLATLQNVTAANVTLADNFIV